MGAGTTAVAALRTGRHYVGFDTDAAYIATAEERIAADLEELAKPPEALEWPVTVPRSVGRNRQLSFAEELLGEPPQNGSSTTARGAVVPDDNDFQTRAGRKAAKHRRWPTRCCFLMVSAISVPRVSGPGGVEINFEALDQQASRGCLMCLGRSA